ncbi:ABC transporter permease [Ferrimonas marina]|uniref:Transport permease protein n=1 Tax=Ferrimonas marina TaxID=299255 RepID=A0A1M5VKC4_9GAMM|nr:ABC transporter permease [Ferrimonas marina]SHH75657.1 capsular polysaccharide transport system permease protein [Ferrimonas marina]
MATVIKRNSWVIWKDVIFALFVREIRTGFNDKFGISWAVASPVVFIFVLSFIRGRLDGGETHTMPTFAFMVYGMVMIQLFLTMLNSCAKTIKKNKALFAFRQVQPISSWLATTIFEALVKIVVLLVIWTVMFFLMIEIRLDNALLLIGNFVALAIFASSFGLLMALLRCYIPETEKLLNMATRPLFFISGVFFSLQDVSPEYWQYLNWNPILHAIELSRQAAYGTFGAVGVSQKYLWLSAITMLFFSLSCYRISWRKAISR